LHSPEVNSEGEITNDNGLFSPLKNLVTLYKMCSGSSYFSRFLFRRSESSYNAFKTLSYIGIINIYDDID